MPNAEGRAATKRTPAKKAAAAAPAAATGEAKPERHVKSPLERAQAVYDKAKATSDKIATRLKAAEDDVKALRAEADEAKVTLDWAASHPLLVKVRRDAEGEGAMVDWDIDNNVPAEVEQERGALTAAAVEGEGPTSAPETEGRVRTGELAAEPEPTPAADVFEQGDEEEQPAPVAPPFPFDAPPTPPAQANGFDFDTGRTTHVS